MGNLVLVSPQHLVQLSRPDIPDAHQIVLTSRRQQITVRVPAKSVDPYGRFPFLLNLSGAGVQ
jgi:hypothetical protein